MKRRVIYTSLVGNYDSLSQPRIVSDDYDYICFSNDIEVSQIGIWKICPIPYTSEDKTRLSRFVKLNPHVALSDYDYSLWMDSNLTIISDGIYDRIDELVQSGSIMASVKHPQLECIYDDALKCIHDGRDSYLAIRKQIRFLLDSKYPPKNGLFENNLIFRKHTDPRIIKISQEWWTLYNQFSRRDQLSLCYVLWRNKFAPDLIFPAGISTRNTSLLLYKGHRKKTFTKRVSSWLVRNVLNRLYSVFFPIRLSNG